MSDFNYQPAYGARVSFRPRIFKNSYGDGYEDRCPDGLNHQPRTWEFSITAETAEIAAIETFFAVRKSVSSFTWTPEGESELVVYVRAWRRVRTSSGVESISVTLTEEGPLNYVAP